MNVALGVEVCDSNNEAIAVDFEAKLSRNVSEANFGGFGGHGEI